MDGPLLFWWCTSYFVQWFKKADGSLFGANLILNLSGFVWVCMDLYGFVWDCPNLLGKPDRHPFIQIDAF